VASGNYGLEMIKQLKACVLEMEACAKERRIPSADLNERYLRWSGPTTLQIIFDEWDRDKRDLHYFRHRCNQLEATIGELRVVEEDLQASLHLAQSRQVK